MLNDNARQCAQATGYVPAILQQEGFQIPSARAIAFGKALVATLDEPVLRQDGYLLVVIVKIGAQAQKPCFHPQSPGS